MNKSETRKPRKIIHVRNTISIDCLKEVIVNFRGIELDSSYFVLQKKFTEFLVLFFKNKLYSQYRSTEKKCDNSE